MSNLNSNQVLSGASWMMLANVASVLLKFITIPILARMLSPEDFGVVALGMSIVFFLTLLGGKGGFSGALIAQKNSNFLAWNSAYWTNIFVGFIFAILMFFFSSELAVFLGSHKATVYIQVLALLIPIQFMVDILNAKLIAQLEFKNEAKVTSFSDVTAGIVSLVAALYGMGAWALILQHFLSQLFRIVGFIKFGGLWMRFQFSLSELKKLMSFSCISIGLEIANFIAMQAPIIIASKFIGISSSGAISIQNRLASLPGDIVLQGISKVLFPIFSQKYMSEQGMKEGFLWSIWLNSIVLVPVLFGIALIAQPLTALVLGEQYEAHWYVLAGLALSKGIMVPCASFNPFMKANGKILALWAMISSRAILVVLLGILGSIHGGGVGLIYGLVLSSVLSFCIFFIVGFKVNKIKYKEAITAIIVPIFATISMSITIKLLFYFTDLNQPLQLILGISTGMSIYVIIILLAYHKLRQVRNAKELKFFFTEYPHSINTTGNI
jgi:succinoglycan exporter